MHVSVETIAKRAQVSTATVSRVMNHKGNVSKRTEQKVFDAIDALGCSEYYKDVFKKEIPRLKIIAVLTTGSNTAFYQDVLTGIQGTAFTHDYEIILVQTTVSLGLTERLASQVKDGSISGVIATNFMFKLYEFLAHFDSPIPLVQCCEYDANLPYPYVAVDDYAAAYQAVSYLISIGRKKISLVASSVSMPHSYYRERAYRDCLKAHGISVAEHLIYHLNVLEFNVAHSAAKELLSQSDIPDAIFCTNDIYAAAVLQVANQMNIAIPEQIAVVGFDNMDIAYMTTPALTTIQQPRFLIGASACATLIDLIEGRRPHSNKTLLSGQLVVRDST